MYILGISAYYHDSAAALIHGETIVAAAQEERFSRKKHDPGFPLHAVQYCLKEAGITLDEVEYIGFYDKPLLKFERLLETYLTEAPKGFKSFMMAMPLWLKEKLFLKVTLCRELVNLTPGSAAMGKQARKALEKSYGKKILFAEHHESHAASAFYPSPFDDAAILTMDGVGEWATTSIAHGKGNELRILSEIHFPHSLGLLYSAFTYYCGFKVNSGEYKLMGLAPYGAPKYADLIRDKLIDIKPDGSFRLDMRYFNYATGLTMTSSRFHELFGQPPRKSETELGQFQMDLAASIQVVTEEVVLKLAKTALAQAGSKNLCLAGGVALNCVANGKILEQGIAEKLFIQPAAGDAGGALGVAQSIYYRHCLQPRHCHEGGKDNMRGSYLGIGYTNDEVQRYLDDIGAVYHKVSNDAALYDQVATSINDGQVIGWHQGRMEFGPRALGGRSIIGDARNTDIQSTMNLKIKFRESFRPFAPAVLREDVTQYFDVPDVDSPYMLIVAPVAEKICKEVNNENLFGIEKLHQVRSDLPAITHVDYSARIQTVHADTNPRFYGLISRMKAISGCSVVVNTSFNVRGEPIVCSPQDSYRCFMRTQMDMLVIEDFILYKAEQPAFNDNEDWQQTYALD
ncbi:MAG: carbamoyltransferase [Alphaproteobacteria bacterium]|nr:carbamoyltransferase [Alphaproteobacteria bacterium]